MPEEALHRRPAAAAERPAPGYPIAFILKGYPRLSETFIAQEIRALELRGLDLRIASLRQPTDRTTHPIHREIAAPILYLPEYLHHRIGRCLAAWRRIRRRPGYRTAVAAFLRDLRRDPSRNRIRRFGQAIVLADEIDPAVGHLHAHFLHTPASVARYAALILGLPWTVSAHAKDIWTTPDWEKREKLASCRWLVTCTAAGHAHLAGLAPAVPERTGRLALAYHGLDFSRFPPHRRALEPLPAEGGDNTRPVSILSVGRAVAKKGYDDLLAALAALPAQLNWRFVHIGGGALCGALRRQAERLGLQSRIDWRGPLTQEAVLAAYRAADIFVLASRIAEDGDRDGLPNVLMEAQSQGVACLATTVSGIGELARALTRLIADPALRAAVAAAGEQRVRSAFDMTAGIDLIATKLAGA